MKFTTNILYNNFLVDRISSLSAWKKVFLLLGSLIVMVPCMIPLMLLEELDSYPLIKVILAVLSVCFAYIYWCVLLSLIPKVKIRNMLANILLVLFPLVMIAAYPNMGDMFQMLRTPEQLVDFQTAPCGDYSAEAYVIKRNSDGTFWGRVDISYANMEKYSHMRNSKTVVFQKKDLHDLKIEWLDDRILLVNGEEVDLDNIGWHFP